MGQPTKEKCEFTKLSFAFEEPPLATGTMPARLSRMLCHLIDQDVGHPHAFSDDTSITTWVLPQTAKRSVGRHPLHYVRLLIKVRGNNNPDASIPTLGRSSPRQGLFSAKPDRVAICVHPFREHHRLQCTLNCPQLGALYGINPLRWDAMRCRHKITLCVNDSESPP